MEVTVRNPSGSRLLLICAALAAAAGASCGMSSSVEPSPVNAAPPALAQISPSASPVGSSVTLTGSGFASTGNTVKFGQGYIRDLPSSDGTTIRFVVPEGLDLCAPDAAGPCAGAFPRTRAGDYAVAVISQKETSNSITFTVTNQ